MAVYKDRQKLRNSVYLFQILQRQVESAGSYREYRGTKEQLSLLQHILIYEFSANNSSIWPIIPSSLWYSIVLNFTKYFSLLKPGSCLARHACSVEKLQQYGSIVNCKAVGGMILTQFL
jgi:hypothetical protein